VANGGDVFSGGWLGIFAGRFNADGFNARLAGEPVSVYRRGEFTAIATVLIAQYRLRSVGESRKQVNRSEL
jgi:hypothetical protein